jgi:hypothetical protein
MTNQFNYTSFAAISAWSLSRPGGKVSGMRHYLKESAHAPFDMA